MDEIRLGDARVRILPVVRGLPSEASTVSSAMDAMQPDVVALSIGPEELEALRAYRGGPVDAENFEEEVYVAGLSAWEEPLKPAPCFTEAIRRADASRARLEGVDMDEAAYTDAYTSYVSAMELIFQSRAERRLARKRFHARTPKEFVLEWDAEVNRRVGFARLQREREAHMARRLREVAASARAVLAVIEVERSEGVLAALRA